MLRAYNDELVYLRAAAREFGEEYPAVAGRLGLGASTEVDPHVERLLEGVAFLGARVQLKLSDQFPDFTQHLLNAIQPHYCAPTPSICIVGFELREGEGGMAQGVIVPRQTSLHATAEDRDRSPVTFRTGQEVKLWPLRLAQAEYLATRAAIAPFVPAALAETVEAGLRLRIEATGGVRLSELRPGSLPVYLDGSQGVPGELYRQLIGDAVTTVARAAGAAGSFVRLPPPCQVGFDEGSALLPTDRRSHRGYRLLTEYFACPERYQFFGLEGLDRAFAACGDADACDVVVLFTRTADALSGAVSPTNFRLFATPAINLFEKQVDRVALDDFGHEYQVVPDRARPLDFELFRLLEVHAHDDAKARDDARAVVPLHDFAGLLYDWSDALFYVTRLRPRRLSTREQRARRRTDYVGTETWMSLSAPGRPDGLKGIRELSVRALVTNRELPELIRAGAATLGAEGLPVRAITMLRPPTRPRPPLGLNDGAWRVISHLTPNYASFAGGDDGDPSVLQSHLALYARTDDAAMRRQVDGIRSVRSAPVSRRLPIAGPSAFVRGQQLCITLDEPSFENAGMFLFGAVLERFLAEFASVNSFTETVFDTVQEGRHATWPARIGQRPTI